MSADAPKVIPHQSGLTPLSAGPIPLSRAGAFGWAAFVFLGTVFFGILLPLFASQVAHYTVPPGSITFGQASIIPADGWSMTTRTVSSVTLDNNGVWITFRSEPAQGRSAAVRALDLGDQMKAAYPQLSVASDPSPFTTPTYAQGQLIALAGSNQTGIAASVVEFDQAVDVESLGESTQFGESIADIEAMIESIRIRVVVADG